MSLRGFLFHPDLRRLAVAGTPVALLFRSVRRALARVSAEIAYLVSPIPEAAWSSCSRRVTRSVRPALPAFLARASFRTRLATSVAAATLTYAMPATAQLRLGETGLTITGTPTVANDYLFRGVSQTRSRPAAQFTAEIAHDSGFYVGAFVSNVAFLGTNARQEVDALAGYRFEALGIRWDVRAIYYAYPGYERPPGSFRLDYLEVSLKASRAFFDGATTVQASAFVSPDFQFQSGRSLYVEGGVDQQVPFGVTLGARLGYLTIERNERFGTPDYLNWFVGLSREVFAGFRLAVGYYDTNISRRECVPVGERTQNICGARVLVSLSRQF